MSGTRKARRAAAVAITANRLLDGAVVWRTGTGDWSETFADAAVIAPDVLDTTLAADPLVVGIYAAALTEHATPASWKERIRAFGPTIGQDAAP